jgi:MerR family transcriptional regulator, light-induced transcriptional regulator
VAEGVGMSRAAHPALERVSTASLCASYLQAQLGGNRREALRLIVEDGLKRGLTCLDIHNVIQQAQREIGRLWQEDRITIAQEHMATAISQVVLSHVYQYADAPRSNGKRVLVACVEGELHDFPARLCADALDLAGFDVRYLGASVPHESLVAMVAAHQPDLLVLSVTMTFHVPSLREAVRRVRERHASVPIAVGGGACSWQPGLAADVDANAEGSDATELVAKAEQLLGVAA